MFPLHLHKLACQTEKGRKRQNEQKGKYTKQWAKYYPNDEKLAVLVKG
jgi:hypothetical protein